MLAPDQIDALAAAAAAPGQPGALLRALGEAAVATLGAGLFTVMLFDEPAMEVERLHSSNSSAYPPGGRKRKRDTDWGRHVLEERRVFVGEGAASIREAFDDHLVILGLGLNAIVNVPVVFDGRCLGTVNILTERETLSDEDVARAKLLGLLAVPALLAALRA